MAGVITINFKVLKDGQRHMGMTGGRSPMYIPGPVQPQFGPGRMLYFEVRRDAHVEQITLDLELTMDAGLLGRREW